MRAALKPWRVLAPINISILMLRAHRAEERSSPNLIIEPTPNCLVICSIAILTACNFSGADPVADFPTHQNKDCNREEVGVNSPLELGVGRS